MAAAKADAWNVPGPPHNTVEWVGERNRILDDHCGTIAVESSPGAGARFTVTLYAEGASPDDVQGGPGVGERTMIQEFMRQLGVPTGGA